MRPTLSVILLTTLIGAGQGLFLALYSVQLYALFHLLPAPDARAFYAAGSLLALLLLAAGLTASFFHLGHPERAWRAATQWRTSWLSREVIVLPALMGSVCLFGAAHWIDWRPALASLPSGALVDVTLLLGALATVLTFALFLCSAMIYACLPFLREWHSPLTVLNFILLGGASGFTLATAFAVQAAPPLVGFLAGWALIITGLGLAARLWSLIRNYRLRPRSTIQTAIGVKHPKVVQKSQGAMGGSFNTREFFHGASPSTMRSVLWGFPLLAFALPAALVSVGLASDLPAAFVAAFATQFVGLLGERWFFFAQAHHPQNLYYQSIS
ncbi:membrane-bound sulfite oxidizing enzyme, membrane anchor subunit [Burkholderiales bacterium]|nr:membrane-bound sulfite oxidizing enzyme, membrane anchor subunit [Burkholderiales bacterium]